MEMFLCPEEILHNFSVEGDIKSETLEEISEKRQLVNFTMNTREQAHYFGSSGFFGTMNLQVKTAKSETILEYPNEYEITPLSLSFLSPGVSLSLTQILNNKTTIVAYEDLVQEDWNNG